MILHKGERVYWGAPEVIYLEGTIVSLDEETQIAIVHIERATPHSAHLIESNLPFAANGLSPCSGESPPGTTTERSLHPLPPRVMSEEEKIHSAAAAAVHQQYGYQLPAAQEQELITQVEATINADSAMRQNIVRSMDEIMRREF